MTFEDLKAFAGVYHHKFVVMKYLNEFIHDLVKRAEEHDSSKFSEAEMPHLAGIAEEVGKFAYGTPEHDAMREKYSSIFAEHYRQNRHHPEHFQNGVDDMTLVDLLEMLADWKAASLRMGQGGSIENSIKVGTEKYNLSPQLVKILENTAKACKM